MSLKHIFWPISDCSSLYATGVTRIQSVVIRWIGGRGHFRSRDKDGGHTVRSGVAKNPMLYANFTTLSFIEPELLPIEVLHCGNREFRVFWQKIVEIIKKNLFAPRKGRSCHRNTFSDPLLTVLSRMLLELHAFKVSFYAESVGVVTSVHVTKMAVTPFDPQ